MRVRCTDCSSTLAASALPPGAPVLILANKVDLPHAATQEELWYSLGLDELQQQGSTRPFVRTHLRRRPQPR